MQLAMDKVGARAILCLDVQKAFDMVEWEYLWAVLAVFGIGPGINNTLSSSFSLLRETRQGCPLCLLLFCHGYGAFGSCN